MNVEAFYQSLENLNIYETLGKAYYESHHRNLSVEQYRYIRNHGNEANLLKLLETPEAVREQKNSA